MVGVSLIITTYQEPDKLKRVLEATLLQTVLPKELIVADDGSGEETAQVVKSFKKKAPFEVKHVWQPDEGFRLAAIRNKAILAAECDYLVFLDGDSIPNRFFIEDHIKLAEKGFFVQGKRVWVGPNASKHFDAYTVNSFKKLLKWLISKELSNAHHLIRCPFFPPIKNTKLRGIKSNNQGIFKEDLLAVNGFNERFTHWGLEDTELAVRLFRYGLKRKEHPFMAICFHLWHPQPKQKLHPLNKQILEETLKSNSYWCPHGLRKS